MKRRFEMGGRIFTLFTLTLWLTSCLYGPVSSSTVADDVEVQMWASGNCVQPGDTVKLRATATNRGNMTWTVETKDSSVLDIVLEYDTSAGRTTIRWSDGKPLTDLTHLELEPGESKTIEMDILIPRNNPPAFIAVNASFISSAAFSRYPASPGVSINVWNCPSALGP